MLSRVQLFVTLWTAPHQAPLYMEFSKQEYWSGLPSPFLEVVPTQGSNLHLPCLPHSRWILYRWATGEAPRALKQDQKILHSLLASSFSLPWAIGQPGNLFSLNFFMAPKTHFVICKAYETQPVITFLYHILPIQKPHVKLSFVYTSALQIYHKNFLPSFHPSP